MINSAGRIVDIIVCDNNLFHRIINACKGREFPVVGFFFRDTVGDLDQVQLAISDGSEIDLPPFCCREMRKSHFWRCENHTSRNVGITR